MVLAQLKMKSLNTWSRRRVHVWCEATELRRMQLSLSNVNFDVNYVELVYLTVYDEEV